MKQNAIATAFLIFSTLVVFHLRSQPALGQEPEDEILRVSTNLVTVPVIVKNREGGYIPNLRGEDFRIYEDGVEQDIASFETVDKPFSVVLMLDVSDSTQAELNDIKNAAVAFLRQLRPEDRASVVAFDKQVVTLTPATSDRQVLADAIRRLRTGGGTALYDTIETVISSHLKAMPGRKALVILTDGIDTSSKRGTYQNTITLASEQSLLIYPIQWNTRDGFLAKQLSRADNLAVIGGAIYTTPSGESLSKAYERGTRYLQRIARTSGGRFQSAEKLQKLEHSFARIAEELRQQYSLNYYPTNHSVSNKKRRIKVRVSFPDAVVHARVSYAYNPGTQ